MTKKKPDPIPAPEGKREMLPCGCVSIEKSPGEKMIAPCFGHALEQAADGLHQAANFLDTAAALHLKKFVPMTAPLPKSPGAGPSLLT